MNTTFSSFSDIVSQKLLFFQTHKTKTLEFRLLQLTQLEKLLSENQSLICDALKADLGKPRFEAWTSEIGVTLEELRYTKKNLSSWMKDVKVKTPLHLLPGSSLIHYEPLGVVLILSPWNYPFQLAMAPLIGVLAAGNCAVIKPSELTPQTSKLIKTLIKKYFDSQVVSVVEGGIPETSALLKERFDHIFFTGSGGVGKIVMKAAAEYLTPVTLELGGKSPVIVSSKADIDVAAKKITWGKFLNAGQTCVAPDYLYVHQSVEIELIERIRFYIQQFFGSNPIESSDYGRIVNKRNLQRLKALVPKDHIYHGGQINEDQLFFEPTLVRGCTWEDAIMKEEIFGPLLPIFTFENLSEVEEKILQGEKPLAAYFFSNDSSEQKQFIHNLSFGGGCINDVIVHLSHPLLPFGGVGQSGMGSYHGEASFKLFSHAKSILKMQTWMDLPLRYPPYKEKILGWMQKFFRVSED